MPRCHVPFFRDDCGICNFSEEEFSSTVVRPVLDFTGAVVAAAEARSPENLRSQKPEIFLNSFSRNSRNLLIRKDRSHISLKSMGTIVCKSLCTVYVSVVLYVHNHLCMCMCVCVCVSKLSSWQSTTVVHERLSMLLLVRPVLDLLGAAAPARSPALSQLRSPVCMEVELHTHSRTAGISQKLKDL